MSVPFFHMVIPAHAFQTVGIVSLLFCGITLKHYAYHNMSRRTQRTSRYTFSMLAQLSENFIFIYLGLSLFTSTKLVYKPLFILVTAVRSLFPFLLCIRAHLLAFVPPSSRFVSPAGVPSSRFPKSSTSGSKREANAPTSFPTRTK